MLNLTYDSFRQAIHIVFGFSLAGYLFFYSVSFSGFLFLFAVGLAFECLYLSLDEIIYRLGVIIDKEEK